MVSGAGCTCGGRGFARAVGYHSRQLYWGTAVEVEETVAAAGVERSGGFGTLDQGRAGVGVAVEKDCMHSRQDWPG